MTSFDLSYDYRCPFAKNIHLHVVSALRAGANFDVNFVPWSLNQGHREAGAPDIWDDPARDGDNLALAASISVRDQQSERFLDAHEALFLARHERGERLGADQALLRRGRLPCPTLAQHVPILRLHRDVSRVGRARSRGLISRLGE